MGEYVSDSGKRLIQQEFIDDLHSVKNLDGLPFVLYQNAVPTKVYIKTADILNALGIDPSSSKADKVLAAYKANTDSTGRVKVEGFLTDLGYKPMKTAPGLAEWTHGAFHDPWVHEEVYDTLSGILKAVPQSNFAQVWLETTGWVTRVLLASPYGVYMDNAYSAGLMSKDGRLMGFWSKQTFDNARRWLPNIMAVNWVKTGKDILTGKGASEGWSLPGRTHKRRNGRSTTP
jgi:hypothetical protein